MSRSRKKNGIIKDKGYLKDAYNKIFRRTNKQRIKQGKDPLLMRELINTYDIIDWIYIFNKRDKWFLNAKNKEKRKREFFKK